VKTLSAGWRFCLEGAMEFELKNFSDEKLVVTMVEMHEGLTWLADALEDGGKAKQRFQLLHARAKILELLNDSRQEWLRRHLSHLPGRASEMRREA
jgi:hypothetical protein